MEVQQNETDATLAGIGELQLVCTLNVFNFYPLEGNPMTKNRICKLLDIQYPIIQAPMNWISGADLVASVSNAGGLGTLGPNAGAKAMITDLRVTGERLRDQIQKVKGLTHKPFAVNIPIGFGEDRKYSQQCLHKIEALIIKLVSIYC